VHEQSVGVLVCDVLIVVVFPLPIFPKLFKYAIEMKVTKPYFPLVYFGLHFFRCDSLVKLVKFLLDVLKR